MNVLVTGGCGFIGSHTCVELLQRGHQVEIVDNLSNAQPSVLDHIAMLCGERPRLHHLDVRDAELARKTDLRSFDAVIHFAALKSVSESNSKPLEYFSNNIGGTLALLNAMETAGVGRLVFSSSATVYGNPAHCPVREDAPLGATNPYGRSKLIAEGILEDLCKSGDGFRSVVLRYFNPVGAHPSGLLGESPTGIPNNLMPYVAQVAIGLRPELHIYGGDYPTPDGTGVRDYIHVVDLATAHVDAIEYLARGESTLTINLGTGRGYSVLEVIDAFENASGRTVPYRVVGRRDGDVAKCYADSSLALDALGWAAKRKLAEMCEDAWRWQRNYPAGYTS